MVKFLTVIKKKNLMEFLDNYSWVARKATVMRNSCFSSILLISANLTQLNVIDLAEENSRERQVFSSNFISKLLDKSIGLVKFISSVLYHSFRKVAITY